MRIFKFKNYREIIRNHIKNLADKSRGEPLRIAKYLRIHPTLVSLILNESRELTLDQAYDLSEYLKLTETETEYFITLVQHSRAAQVKHKDFLKKKIDRMIAEQNKISVNFDHEKKLDDAAKSIFYSSWIYSAIRLFCDTKKNGVSIEEIVTKFKIGRKTIVEILNFLETNSLITSENQKFKLGVQRTFLDFGSPHLKKHHANWRVKAIQQSDFQTEDELMFTCPMSISKEDFLKIRELLTEVLSKTSKVIKDSKSEEVACLNIDLFYLK